MELTKQILDLVKATPNDMELGEKLRQLFPNNTFIKEHPNDMELGNKVRKFSFKIENNLTK